VRNNIISTIAAVLFGAGSFGFVLFLTGFSDRQVQQLSLLLIMASSGCLIFLKAKPEGYRGEVDQ
jgi:hypothetical protein